VCAWSKVSNDKQPAMIKPCKYFTNDAIWN